MNQLGDIIKKRRKEFGITQHRLAEMSDININTLTQIERGEGNPTIRSIERVLKTLGMQLTAKVMD